MDSEHAAVGDLKHFKIIFMFWSGVKKTYIPELISKIESAIFNKHSCFKYVNLELKFHTPIIGDGSHYEDWLIDFYLNCDPEAQRDSVLDGMARSLLLKKSKRELKRTRFGKKMCSKASKIKSTGINFYSAVYHCTVQRGEEPVSGRSEKRKMEKFRNSIKDFKINSRNRFLDVATSRSAPLSFDSKQIAALAHNIVHCFIFNTSEKQFKHSVEHAAFKKNIEFLEERCKTSEATFDEVG